MPKFEMPENVLAASEKLLLRDLLASPTFCYWMVSCLCNGLQTNHLGLEDVSDDEDFFVFKLQKILGGIPQETKLACFKASAQQVSANRAAREEKRLLQNRVIR